MRASSFSFPALPHQRRRRRRHVPVLGHKTDGRTKKSRRLSKLFSSLCVVIFLPISSTHSCPFFCLRPVAAVFPCGTCARGTRYPRRCRGHGRCCIWGLGSLSSSLSRSPAKERTHARVIDSGRHWHMARDRHCGRVGARVPWQSLCGSLRQKVERSGHRNDFFSSSSLISRPSRNPVASLFFSSHGIRTDRHKEQKKIGEKGWEKMSTVQVFFYAAPLPQISLLFYEAQTTGCGPFFGAGLFPLALLDSHVHFFLLLPPGRVGPAVASATRTNEEEKKGRRSGENSKT